MARLGDVLRILSARSVPATSKNWLLNLEMVQQQTGKVIDYQYVSPAELEGSIVSFDTSIVLYSKLRPNLNKVVVPEQNGYCTSEMLPLQPDAFRLTREYLAWYLRSDSFVTWAVSKTFGAKMPRLGTKELLSHNIPLPDLPIQRRIAATLDKVSEGIDLCRKMLGDLDALVKSQFVEMVEGCGGIPTRMGDIASYINGAAFKPKDWSKNGKPIIRIQNLNDPSAEYNCFSGQIDEKYLVKPGEVLISWATHLEAYIWNGEEAWLNQHIFRVVFDKMDVDKTFFIYAANVALKEAFKLAHGFKPTMEHIKRGDFEDSKVYLPPKDTQVRFAVFAEQTDKSKSAIQQQLSALETLKKSLMQKYFA